MITNSNFGTNATPKNQDFSNTTAPDYEQGYLDSLSGGVK
jgi:hypothetical protein